MQTKLNFESVHWIPTHKAGWDKDWFAVYKPEWFKVVVTDTNVGSFLNYAPTGSKIVIRNHPMSELFDNRGSMRSAEEADGTGDLWSPDGTDETYGQYWQAWGDELVRRRMALAGKVDARDFAPLADGMPANSFTPWRGGIRAGLTETGDNSKRALAENSAEAIAEQHSAICYETALNAEKVGVPRSRLWFEGINEPQIWGPEPEDVVARYNLRFLLANRGWGGLSVLYNLGVGWFGNHGVQDAPADWSSAEPVAREMSWKDSVFGKHEYWALNGPQENWGWWAGTWRDCPWDIPILITECGIDTGVTGNWYGGWLDLPGSMDEKADQDVAWTRWYAEQAVQDHRPRGGCKFTHDIGSPHWEKFDTRYQSWYDAYCRLKTAKGMLSPQEYDGPSGGVIVVEGKAPMDPASEPIAAIGTIAEKIRWHTEESVRWDEACLAALEVGDLVEAKRCLETAMTIRYGLIRLDGIGLMYRLENALKANAQEA